MVFGAHVILYSADPEADRAFFRGVMGFASVDAGHGWLIFALPPAEIAFHPTGNPQERMSPEFYFMCKDLGEAMATLTAAGAPCGDVSEHPWGRLTSVTLPSGGKIGLYQPLHPMAIG